MPVKINQSGTPSAPVIIPALTGERAAAVEKIVTPTPPSNSFSGVVADLLSGLNAEAVIIVDTKNRKVYASTTHKDMLKAAYTGKVPAAKDSVLTPVAGQTGTSLEFNKACGNQAKASVVDTVNTITEPVKPKKSVASVISTLLAEAVEPGDEKIICIDQTGKQIRVVPASDADVDGMIDAIADNRAGDNAEIIEIELSGEDTTVNNPVSRLAFEGGEV